MTYVERLGSKCWKDFHIWVQCHPSVASLGAWKETVCQCYPCVMCRKHLCEIIQPLPRQPYSKEDTIRYMFSLHNDINRALHKGIRGKDVLKQYQSVQAETFFKTHLGENVDWKKRFQTHHACCKVLRMPSLSTST